MSDKMSFKGAYVLLFLCGFASIIKLIYGRSIDQRTNENTVEGDTKVHQTGSTTGFVLSNSTATAFMLASGSPAGIINAGGTTTSFNGSSTLNQDLPSNTSSSVGGSLSANCGGGQYGTYVAGQQQIGLHSVGNCNSFVDSKASPSVKES